MKSVSRIVFFGLLLVMVAAALLWSVPTIAQTVKYFGMALDASEVPPSPPPSSVVVSGLAGPSNYGVGWNTYKLSPGDFIRRDSCSFNGIPDLSNLVGITPASGQSSICVGAPVHLPTGASLRTIYFVYNDTHPTSDPSVGLWKYDMFGVTTQVGSMAVPSFSGGNNTAEFDLTTPETIDNFNYSYYFLAILDRSTVTPSQLEKIYSVHLGYMLQVSPAPLAASFIDVPTTHPWFQWIEALRASGITAGCSVTPSLFCPDQPVTRGQMAIFLSRGLGLYWPY
jgi:hypothetical protein